MNQHPQPCDRKAYPNVTLAFVAAQVAKVPEPYRLEKCGRCSGWHIVAAGRAA